MVYRGGDLTIDEAGRELWRAGQRVAVEPRVFDLILYLIRHRDRVVSKTELLDALWLGRDIYESALSVCVYRARAALGSNGRRLIRTVPRRGFRFEGQLEESNGTTHAEPATALIGRGAELREASLLLHEVREGAARVLLVTGEPGIGKTSFTEHLAALARGHGIDTLWAHGEHGGTTPYGCWRQLFEAYLATRGVRHLTDATELELASLAWIAPSSEAQIVSLVRRARREGRPLGELFDGIVRMIARVAQANPLALILDDCDVLDGDSLSLLILAVERLRSVRVLIVCTFDSCALVDHQRFAAVVKTLQDDGDCRAIQLGPLGATETAEVLQTLARAPVQPALQAIVQAGAAGNPLYVAEYWRYLVNHGLAVLEPTGWESRGASSSVVPPALRAVVQKRLDRLSSSTQRAFVTAALLGVPFSPRELAAATRQARSAIIAAIAEAERASIVRLGPAGAYEFMHPLLREQLCERVPVEGRALLHRRIALAFEKFPERAARLTEIAHHWVEGADADSASHAIDRAQQAGQLSFAQSAFLDAAGWVWTCPDSVDTPTQRRML